MMKKETSLSIVSSQICICIGDIVYLPYILYIYVNKCITSLYCSVFMMAEQLNIVVKLIMEGRL